MENMRKYFDVGKEQIQNIGRYLETVKKYAGNLGRAVGLAIMFCGCGEEILSKSAVKDPFDGESVQQRASENIAPKTPRLMPPYPSGIEALVPGRRGKDSITIREKDKTILYIRTSEIGMEVRVYTPRDGLVEAFIDENGDNEADPDGYYSGHRGFVDWYEQRRENRERAHSFQNSDIESGEDRR